ncbi:hypothetical protein IFM89_034402 [Coptis chinensis]|uniref:F-box associated beta-propeller type 3 domain-containing protein n=1 Tax=Coptis chinensis TaxID=261450 RepID=A0A835MBG4_9MAGN|nr:hypothetical protein IFM89_034402 [Coptis chinensis]
MIKALRQPRCLILEPRDDYGRPRNSLFLVDRDECREIPLKQQELKFGNNIAGSCNGLLCIGSCLRDKTIIYNPITRESMELPKMSPKDFEKLETIYGFGFDHVTKKYKVVFVYRFIDIDYYGAKKAPVTMGEIITVGGSWRKLKFPYKVQFKCKPETVFLDGSFHWKIDKDRPTGSEARILALDISTEKFHTYSFPPALELPNYYSLCLINFAGSLAFVDTKIRCNESSEIWRIFDPKTNYRRIYRYTCKPLGAVGWWNRWKAIDEERERGRAREKSRSRSRSSSRSVSPNVDIEWFYRKGKAEMREEEENIWRDDFFLDKRKNMNERAGEIMSDKNASFSCLSLEHLF